MQLGYTTINISRSLLPQKYVITYSCHSNNVHAGTRLGNVLADTPGRGARDEREEATCQEWLHCAQHLEHYVEHKHEFYQSSDETLTKKSVIFVITIYYYYYYYY
jgi:hypothetical protein